MTQKKVLTDELFAVFCAEIANDKKAEDVVTIKVKNVSLIADYFIVCTGKSTPHINAIAEGIRRKAREKYNIRPYAIDGKSESQWIVLDFGAVMVHVLSDEARMKYQLETLWNDAEKMEKFLSGKTRKNEEEEI